MERTFSVLVENKRGVLSKISGLFAQRGFNIKSLAVGETENPTISRMTIVVVGNEQVLDQIQRQLEKQIQVIKVVNFSDLPKDDLISSEHVFARVECNKQELPALLQIVRAFKGEIRSINADGIIVEIIGDQGKIQSFEQLMKARYKISELVRSGPSAISRSRVVTLEKKKGRKK